MTFLQAYTNTQIYMGLEEINIHYDFVLKILVKTIYLQNKKIESEWRPEQFCLRAEAI